MGRAPCCSKVGLHRGPWSAEEDTLLVNYIREHGEGQWRNLPKRAGLLRCGKSCRLRWMNYLRPDIKRGNIASDEEDLIIRLHSLLGNRWSIIAGRLPGRTDNEIKNYWNSHLGKKVLRESATETDKKTPKALPKKRSHSQSTNAKKHAKDNNIDSANHEHLCPTETKIYLPKATKASPYSITIKNRDFDSCRVGGSSSSGDGDGVENVGSSASDGEGVMLNPPSPFRPNNCDHKTTPVAWNEEYYNNLINEIDISLLDFVSTGDDGIDEVFEEYQRLLNFDENIELDS